MTPGTAKHVPGGACPPGHFAGGQPAAGWAAGQNAFVGHRCGLTPQAGRL